MNHIPNTKQFTTPKAPIVSFSAVYGNGGKPKSERDFIFVHSEVFAKAPPIPRTEFLKATAAAMGVPLDDMQGPRRFKSIVRARQIYYFLCRVHTGQSFAQIAKLVNVGHSTVVHGVRLVALNLEVCEAALSKVEGLLKLHSKQRNMTQIHAALSGWKAYPSLTRKLTKIEHWEVK